MAKRGGFPGGGMPGNMANLMKAGAEDAAPDGGKPESPRGKGIYGSRRRRSGRGDSIGQKELTRIKIDPEAVDPDDVEMLEDMIMAAVNQALRQQEEDSAAMMSKLTGGLGGGFPF